MKDVILHNSPANLVESLFSFFTVDMTTHEQWESLLKIDASDNAALLVLFRETIDFSLVDDATQRLLTQAMSIVLNDANFDYALIFDEIDLPFHYNVNDNERLRQWVLTMWEACTGRPFELGHDHNLI